MSIIIDLILIIIIALCIFKGYKNGFVKTVVDLISGAAAFVFAYIFSPIVSKIFYGMFFEPIKTVINDKLLTASQNNGVEAIFAEDGVLSQLGKLIESCGLSIGELQSQTSSLSDVKDICISIAESIAAPTATAASYVIAFILLFVIGNIAMRFISVALKLITKLPVIKSADKLLGLAVGLVTAIIFSTVYMTVIKLFVPYLTLIAPNAFAPDILDKTYVLNFLYDLNILNKIFAYASLSASFLK